MAAMTSGSKTKPPKTSDDCDPPLPALEGGRRVMEGNKGRKGGRGKETEKAKSGGQSGVHSAFL